MDWLTPTTVNTISISSAGANSLFPNWFATTTQSPTASSVIRVPVRAGVHTDGVFEVNVTARPLSEATSRLT